MIDSFRGKWKPFSNFFPVFVEYNHVLWESVEHGYQAAKDIRGFNSELVQKILDLGPYQAGEAKKIGREIEKSGFMRPDWKTPEGSLTVMSGLVKSKFEPLKHLDLRELLDSTKGHLLVEGNKWHDNFWGDCYCQCCIKVKGRNMLGKLLMENRDGVIYI